MPLNPLRFTNLKSELITFFVLIFLPISLAQASCTRDDIDHYLKQGFNHQQVVSLCNSNSTPAKQSPQLSTQAIPAKSEPTPQPRHQLQQTQKPAPLPIPVYQYESTRMVNNHPDAVFLATAIEAYDLEITDSALIFTRKDCFNYGQEDWNEFKNRACPHIKYTVKKNGLKIVERDNGFFGLGSTALHISGNIEAEILDLDQFKEKYHQEINAVIEENTKKLQIDVRAGMPQSKVETVLLRLSKQL